MKAKTKFGRLIAIFCLSFCLPFTASYEFIVDPTSSSPNEFRSLEEAFSQVGWYLYYLEVTFTLASSCAGTTQTLGDDPILFGYYPFTIKFEENPPLSQESDCFLLPRLAFGPGTTLYAQSLPKMTLQGVNIQFIADPAYTSLIYEVNEVEFTNVCFNNSEPSRSLPEGYMGYDFYIYQASKFTVTNMIFLNDGYKRFFIYNTKETLITNLVFIQLPWAKQTSNNPMTYYNVAFPDSTINITSFSIMCDPTSDLAPNLVWIRGFGTATISDMSISECNLQRSSLNKPFLFNIQCGKHLSINGLSIRNIKHRIPFIATLIIIEKILSVKLSNIDISNVVTDAVFLKIADHCVTALCYCDFDQSSTVSVEVTNWKITHSQFFNLSIMLSEL